MMPLSCLKWVPTGWECLAHTHTYRHVHAHTGTQALVHVHTTYVCPRPQTYAYMHTGCVHVYTHLAMHRHVPQAMHVHELSTPIHRYTHTGAHIYAHTPIPLASHTIWEKQIKLQVSKQERSARVLGGSGRASWQRDSF